jgi:hypothetical protein
MQERRKVLDTPGIVDHQQAAPIIERVGQRELGGVEGAEARTGAVENLDELGDAADQIVGLLAEGDGGAQRGRRQHQHDMLDAANRCLDLTPPILTALETVEIAVALEGETSGLEQRLQASSALEAIRARV